MKNRDDSCLKSQGLPSQMTMGGGSFLKLVFFLSAYPVICVSECLQRENFFKMQIRKPNFFFFGLVKKGNNLHLNVSSQEKKEGVFSSSSALLVDCPPRTFKNTYQP